MKLNLTLLKRHNSSLTKDGFMSQTNFRTRISERLISIKGPFLGIIVLFLFVQNALAQPNWESSTTAEGTGNIATVNKPSGVVGGHLMIVGLMYQNGTNVSIIPPTGWTLIRRDDQGTNIGMATYYYVATNTEPSSYSFTLTNTPRWAIGASRITDANILNPINISGGTTGTTGNVTAPSVTTTSANNHVLSFFTNLSTATFTGVATEHYDDPHNTNGNTAGPSNMMASFDQVLAGATDAKVATPNPAGTTSWVGQQVAINYAFESTVFCDPFTVTYTIEPPNNCTASNGDVLITEVTGGGGGPYTYLWMTVSGASNVNGITGPHLNTIKAGVYNVVITNNGFSCSLDIQVQVDNTIGIPSSPDVTICNGSSTTLTATGCVQGYIWSDSQGGTLSETSSYTTPNLNMNTTYFVACTSGGSSCGTTEDPVTVTISDDNMPPSITDCADTRNIPGCNTDDITTPPFSDVSASSSVSEFESSPNNGVITDDCGISTVTYIDVVTQASCPVIVSRTWSASDAGNNTSTCIQIINVNDVTPPTANTPTAINVECFSDIPASNIAVVTGEADNCGGTPSVAYQSDNITSAVCDGATVTVTRTYRITDCSGNTLDVYQAINVDDITPPTANTPLDITVECFSDIPASNIAVVTGEADNCDGTPGVVWQSDNITSAVCDGATVTVTRTYRVTDCSGNTLDVYQAINVDDITPPTGNTPTAINVECFSDIPAPNIAVVTGEADNCDGTPSVAWQSDNITSAVCDGATVTVTRTYRISDCSGNTLDVYQAINVDDITPPTANTPTAINVECFSDIPASNIAVVTGEADNCDGTPSVAWQSDNITSAVCDGAIVTVTRTYRISDCSGNTLDVYQAINVDDITPPTANTPTDITVECFSDIPASNIAVVTGEADNCDGTPNVVWQNDNIASAVCDGATVTVTRTYRITDCSGNTLDVYQAINVDDITPPTGNTPTAINVECFSDIPAPNIAVVTGEADNCDGTPSVEWHSDNITSAVCDGATVTVTRTYRISDCSGNTLDVYQAINVDDITPPTANTPTAINVECFSDIPASNIAVVTGEADNCDGTPSVAWHSDNITSAVCDGAIVTVTRTYRISDCSGNTLDVYQSINVDDITPPTANTPTDITVECFSDIPASNIAVVTGEADNCDGTPSVAWHSDNITSAVCDGAIVTVTRTYRISDCSGNTLDVYQSINVDDITPPTANTPTAINVECFSDIPASNIAVVTGEADNCDGTPSVAWQSDNITSAVCDGAIVTVTRTYRISDCSGNTLDVYQSINVDDITPPTANTPTDITVECFSDIPASNIAVVTGEADNCDGTPSVAWQSDNITSAVCDGAIVTVTRTYRISDCSGNTLDVYQSINVDDITPPTANTPTAINVECFSDIPASNIAVVTGEADNCDGTPSVAWQSDNITSAVCDGAIVTVTRTYRISDCSGNTLDVYQAINVDDITPPTANTPTAINVECFSDIPASNIAVVTGEADNCDGTPSVAWQSDNITSAVCDGATVTVTRTYRISDCSGNTLDVYQSINVDDITPPTANTPTDITVECFSDIPASNIAVVTGEADNCDGTPSVAWQSDNITSAVCDGATVTVTRTYRISDCSGNTLDVYQSINVDDITPPTANTPTDITVECFSDIPASNIAVVTGEADNCDGTPSVAWQSDNITSAVCDGAIVTVTRTYRISDCSGNTLDVYQAINVDDITPPTANTPTAINVECFSDIPASNIAVVTGEADNCDGTPSVAWQSDNITSAVCDGAIVTVTRTYRISDCSGNTLDVYQSINVDDITPPTANTPTAINVECFSDIPASNIAVVTGEADNCDGTPSVAWHSDNITSAVCDGAIVTVTRTYRISDCSGNTLDVYQSINVDDITPPTANTPTAINVECFSDIPASNIAVVTGEADNCDGTPSVAWQSDNITSAVCDGATVTVTRTYRISDCSGNTLDVYQAINVDDITPPTANTPTAINVECFSDIPASNIAVVTGEADNCDGTPSVAWQSDNITSAVCDGATVTVTRTYRISDCSGNTLDVYQSINVDDITPPTANTPTAINVECFSDIPASNIAVVTGEADNCDGTPSVAWQSDNITSAVCDGATVTVTRTYRISDCSGNTLDVYQAINVDDITPPTANTPTAINVECFSDIPASNIAVVTGESDNCDGTPSVAWQSDNITSAVCDGATVTVTRTYRISDCSGNTLDVYQSINVDDITLPTANTPAPINVQCIGNVPLSNVLVVTGETDNCDGTPSVTFVGDSNNGGAGCPGNPYVVTRTYRVQDCSGNSMTVTQTITAVDNTPPTASNPTPVNVQCIGNIPAQNVLVVTNEADNCTPNPTVTYIGDSNNGGSGCPGSPYIVTRTYRITDLCSNTTQVTQTITVIDNTGPVLTCPANIIIDCTESTMPSSTGTATATDNCDATPNVTYTETQSFGNRPHYSSRNLASCPITQCDDIPNLQQETDHTMIVDVDLLGDCTLGFVYTFSGSIQNANQQDDCLFDSDGDGDYDDQCFEFIYVRGPNSVIGALTFDFGKGEGCTGEIDGGLAQVNGNCIELGTGGSQNSAGPLYFENDTIRVFLCDNSSGVVSMCNVCVFDPPCESDVTITRTWKATDDCGNTSTCIQNIFIKDNNDPVIGALPAPSTIVCDDTPSFTTPSVSDPCDPNPELTHIDVETPGECVPDYSITRIWTATDECGNNSTASQVINIDCDQVEVNVFLEGPYDSDVQLMGTQLNYFHILPGQDPDNSASILAQLIGITTPPGQPYFLPPFLYNGTEGDDYGDDPDDIPYDPTVVDWLLLSVRAVDSLETSEIWKCAALLYADGDVYIPPGCPCLETTPGTDYYIVVEHRNHLPVMSTKIEAEGGVLSFDFTQNQSWIWTFLNFPIGVGQKLIGNNYVMHSGNSEQISARGDINATDDNEWNLDNGGLIIYRRADHDLNGDVNTTDEFHWLINNGKLTFIPFP